MAMKSMTGFGRGSSAVGGLKIEVELSTVNRKQFDVRLNMPRELFALEGRVTEQIHGVVSRGSVTGAIRLALCGQASRRAVRVDIDAARACLDELRRAGAKLKIPDNFGLCDLLRFPDVLRVEALPCDVEDVWKPLSRALGTALRALDRMRRTEGRVLQNDILARCAAMGELVETIASRAPRVAANYRETLVQRIAAAGAELRAEDPQLLREVALFADRADISEELVRLRSHLRQAPGMATRRGPVGRTLDFLCQEMFREINTIGSKANDLAIATTVIDFKAALESVREQIQNVE